MQPVGQFWLVEPYHLIHSAANFMQHALTPAPHAKCSMQSQSGTVCMWPRVSLGHVLHVVFAC